MPPRCWRRLPQRMPPRIRSKRFPKNRYQQTDPRRPPGAGGNSPELLWAKNSSLIHLFHIIFLDFFCKTAYTVYVLYIQLSDQIFKENLIFSFPFPTSFYGILYPVLKQYAPGHGGRQAVPRLFSAPRARASGACSRGTSRARSARAFFGSFQGPRSFRRPGQS